MFVTCQISISGYKWRKTNAFMLPEDQHQINGAVWQQSTRIWWGRKLLSYTEINWNQSKHVIVLYLHKLHMTSIHVYSCATGAKYYSQLLSYVEHRATYFLLYLICSSAATHCFHLMTYSGRSLILNELLTELLITCIIQVMGNCMYANSGLNFDVKIVR